MAKYHDIRKYDLYEYTTTPHDTTANDFGFLTNLNTMWTISTDTYHTTRKLIARGLTREEAGNQLRGTSILTVKPHVFPSGNEGITLIMKTYTLELDGVIHYINPGIDEVARYNGKTYRPVNASECWDLVEEE